MPAPQVNQPTTTSCLEIDTQAVYQQGATPYLSCNILRQNYDMVDFGILAWLAYTNNGTRLFNYTANAFPELDIKYVSPTTDLLPFVRFDHKQTNLTVPPQYSSLSLLRR